MTGSALYTGWVMHRRLRPRQHQFRYRVFSLLIDLGELPLLDRKLRLFAWNRFGLFSFQDRDHGDGRPLSPWLDDLLQGAGIVADGTRQVLCYPRILGYVFNPISVWFCRDRARVLKAIVYEVHNTHGERHFYVLPVAGNQAIVSHDCPKDFYVSPFLSNDCRYFFHIRPPGEKVAVVIHEKEMGTAMLDASFTGDRRPLTDRALLTMLVAYPLMTLKVVVAIHFEAVRLMLKGIRRHPHSPAPPTPVVASDSRLRWVFGVSRCFLGLVELLAACSPAALINLAVPRAGYHVERDLAYGADPRQKLDLYVPGKLTAPAPVVLFFYGGSWKSGTKSLYRAFGQAFASQGMIVAVADYRLYPQVRYPAFVQDGAQAFAWLHAHAAAHGGDPNRLFLAGHSAGAYIAVMLAADPRYLAAAGADLAQIRGVIGIAGPSDFQPLTDQDLIDIFGGADRRQTQPIDYIDGPRPPMLLAAGTDDTTVSPGNTSRLAAKLRAFGTMVEEKHYPGAGHIGVLLSLVPGLRGRTALYQDMLAFLRAH